MNFSIRVTGNNKGNWKEPIDFSKLSLLEKAGKRGKDKGLRETGCFVSGKRVAD